MLFRSLFITWHLSVSPVFVELESFEAAYNPGSGVTISWSIGSGHQTRSFSVLRSDRRDGPQQPVKTLTFDSPLKNRQFSVIDPLDTPGTYFYRLREISLTGEQRIFDPAEVTVAAPEQFVLEQNIPNPFNPTTRIAFQLPRSTHVTLQIFNQNGQLVRTLVNTSYSAGRHTVTWQARNDNGGRVPSGVYFYKMECDEYSRIRKLLLLK